MKRRRCNRVCLGGGIKTDFNVTYPVATNISQIQSWWIPWIPAVIGVIGALLGASVAGIANYYIQKLLIKNDHFEKRKQIYIELSGISIYLKELFYSHARAFVLSWYYQSQSFSKFIYHLQANGPFKDLRESENFLADASDQKLKVAESEKIEKYGLMLAQSEKQLYRIIGRIRISFDNTGELDRL